jgi:hypothetical protein
VSESTVLAPAAKLKSTIKTNINTGNAQKKEQKDNVCILVQAVEVAATADCPVNPSAPTVQHSGVQRERRSADR